MRTTIDINDALLRELRRKAGSEGRSFKQVIEDVLHRGLGRHEGAAKRLKIPAHDIGLKPAYRAASMNQLYDQLELEGTARVADR
jgi:hypothetical protein